MSCDLQPRAAVVESITRCGRLNGEAIKLIDELRLPSVSAGIEARQQGNDALDSGDTNRPGSCAGIESNFSGTREVTQNSRSVATTYVHQQAHLIRSDILGIGSDIAHARPLFDQDRGSFRCLLATRCLAQHAP